MSDLHILIAWVCFLTGMLSGAAQGLLFHHETWMGGYNSWRRRLTRLGHVAFFGTGAINLAFALTLQEAPPHTTIVTAASWLFIFGAITMPLVCYLAAWRQPWRHLFVFPVGSLILAVALFLAHLGKSILGAS